MILMQRGGNFLKPSEQNKSLCNQVLTRLKRGAFCCLLHNVIIRGYYSCAYKHLAA